MTTKDLIAVKIIRKKVLLKSWSLFLILFLVTIGHSPESYAFILTPRPKALDLSSTEAATSANTECKSCLKGSSGLFPIPLRGVASGPERVFKTALFESDKRRAISELRRKNPNLLTAEEKAILQGSTRVGTLSCPNREGSTNATLIRLPNGNDGLITSAHSFLDENNQPICDLTQVLYSPNQSYLTNNGQPATDFAKVKVSTNGKLPLNLENVGNGTNHGNDFLIFELAKNVSSDILPDGSVRGYMKMDTRPVASLPVYFLGRNTQFQKGRTIAYESQCQSIRENNVLYHTCGTTATSSSSAITKLQNGELVLSGIHKDQMGKLDDARPMPQTLFQHNGGVPIENILEYMKLPTRPVAPDDISI